MAAEFALINAALTRTGNAQITELDDGSPAGAIAGENYDQLVAALLTGYPWTWAIKTETLVNITGTPAPPWLFAYQLPIDLLKLSTVTVEGSLIQYEQQSNKILCNSNTAVEVIAKYTWDVPSQYWPGIFTEAVCQFLEAMFLRGIGERYQEAEAREKAANATLILAKRQDAEATKAQVARAMLTSHPWHFATKTAALVATTTPQAPWLFAYTMPSDALKIVSLSVAGAPIEYEQQGARLLCNAAASVIAKYIWSAPETDWPGTFIEAVVQRLEAQVMRDIGEHFEEAEAHEKTARETLVAAKRQDAEATRGQVVKALLTEHPWRFATKTATLAIIAVTPDPPWLYAYTIPSDLLKLSTLTVGGQPIDYETQTGMLLCNADGSVDVIAKYTANVSELLWPTTFTDAVSQRFEALFLQSIGARDADKRTVEARQALSVAKLADSQSRSQRNPWTSPTLQARGSIQPERDTLYWR